MTEPIIPIANDTARKVELASARARRIGLALVAITMALLVAVMITLLVLGIRLKDVADSNKTLLANQAKGAVEGAKVVDEFRTRFADQQETIKQGQLCMLSRLTAHQIDTILAHAALLRGQHQRLNIPNDLKPPPLPVELEKACGQFFASGGISQEVADALNMPPITVTPIAPHKPVPATPGQNGTSGSPGQQGSPGTGTPGPPGPSAPPPAFPPPTPQPPSPIDQIIKMLKCTLLNQCGGKDERSFLLDQEQSSSSNGDRHGSYGGLRNGATCGGHHRSYYDHRRSSWRRCP